MTLDKFCEAIKWKEGYFAPCKKYPEGSVSWRNKNPANFRHTALVKELGAIGKDAKGYAIFKSPEIGMLALKLFVIMAIANKLRDYKRTMTILQYFSTYAPKSDGNDPKKYTEDVCKRIGISPSTPIYKLIS